MQQRQLRLGDILDDYCPRERRLTNHAVVAMVGDEVKQTRCTTCDADHEYKHARVPRQRRKLEPAALYSQVAAGAPKKVVHETVSEERPASGEQGSPIDAPTSLQPEDIVVASLLDEGQERDDHIGEERADPELEEHREPEEGGEGPVHRPLIRAQLPRAEGQPPPVRPAPDFTIRQPAGRQNRFRPRHARGGQGFQGNRPGGNVAGNPRGGPSQHGRPPMPSSRPAQRQGHGRKRSK